jgi:hypothetical protein
LIHPSHRIRIRRGLQCAARHTAKVIGYHVVKSHPLAFPENPVQKLNQFQRFHFEPGLFHHLAYHRIGERFAYFKHSSGQRPMALQRLAAALHQQHAALLHDHRAHTNQRRQREFSLHASYDSACTV